MGRVWSGGCQIGRLAGEDLDRDCAGRTGGMPWIVLGEGGGWGWLMATMGVSGWMFLHNDKSTVSY